MRALTVPIQVLAHAQGLSLPSYESALAAGMDVLAACQEPVSLSPGSRALIPTGLCVALPEAWEIQVRPRSGLAWKHGITCLNSPGTIDADYRGEIQIILANMGQETFVVQRGMRIAQLVLAPVHRALWQPCQALDATQRGAAGFGSTGLG